MWQEHEFLFLILKTIHYKIKYSIVMLLGELRELRLLSGRDDWIYNKMGNETHATWLRKFRLNDGLNNWLKLCEIGQKLSQVEKNWTNLSKNEQIKAELSDLKQNWTNLNKTELNWAILSKSWLKTFEYAAI